MHCINWAMSLLSDCLVLKPPLELKKNGVGLSTYPHTLRHPSQNLSFMAFHQKNYPWPWLITHYYTGNNPDFETEDEHKWLAIELAKFLNEFHTAPLIEGAPQSRRGMPLKNMDQQTRQEIARLGDEFDTVKLTQLWQSLCDLPRWQHNPIWIHGYVLPGNILIDHQKLSAVIDFSDVGLGDPACDLIIAWALFNKKVGLFLKNSFRI